MLKKLVLKHGGYCVIFLMLFFVFIAGGCGDSDSGSGSGYSSADSAKSKIYLYGEMHGDLSDEISSLTNIRSYNNESDAPLIISLSENFTINEKTALAARKVYEAGYAVAVEHATESEVNKFLAALGLPQNFAIPEYKENGANVDHSHVEFFGVKTINGDILTYATLNDDQPIEELNTSQDTIYVTSGDEVVSIDVADYENASSQTAPTSSDYALAAEKGYEIKLDSITNTYKVYAQNGDEITIADLVLENAVNDEKIPPDTSVSDDVRAAQEITQAKSIVDWIYSTRDQAKRAATLKASTQKELSVAKASDNDLTKISKLYQKIYDASSYGQVFKIFIDVYACHTFNSAASGSDTYNNAQDSDWYFIKQSAQLNPAANYAANLNGYGTNAGAWIKGYMVSYKFENWLVDKDGKEITNAGVEIRKPKPDSTVGSSGTSESTSFNFGGNVGISGIASTGGPGLGVGLSAGASYSYGTSHTVPDTQVDNQSVSGSAPKRAVWLYSFSRPQTTGHPFAGYNNFLDAPTASRSLFQPENQWAWQVFPSERERVKGFKFRFTWKNGNSYSEDFAFWIKVDDAQHYDWVTKSTEFNVPFDSIIPPLIAANNIDFHAKGDFERIPIGATREWEAKSDSAWCKIGKTSGTPTNGADDLVVTVDANTSGEDRTAYITLSTTSATGKTESCKVRIYQSRY